MDPRIGIHEVIIEVALIAEAVLFEFILYDHRAAMGAVAWIQFVVH